MSNPYSYYLAPHNPHKIYLLAICTIGGVLGLIAPEAVSESVARALPDWATYVWSGGLATSAGLALYGSWRGTLHGANLERLGLCVLAAICLVWGTAVILANPTHGWGAGLFYGGFAVANVARVRILNRGLRQVQEVMTDGS